MTKQPIFCNIVLQKPDRKALPMDANRIIELLDTLTAPELRRVLAHAQELDAKYKEWEDPNYTPGPTPGDGRTYRQEWTRCNKTGCRSCAELGGHGPYWYAYWREDGKLKKKYIGKELHRTT